MSFHKTTWPARDHNMTTAAKDQLVRTVWTITDHRSVRNLSTNRTNKCTNEEHGLNTGHVTVQFTFQHFSGTT